MNNEEHPPPSEHYLKERIASHDIISALAAAEGNNWLFDDMFVSLSSES
jgi:hypothetical protein